RAPSTALNPLRSRRHRLVASHCVQSIYATNRTAVRTLAPPLLSRLPLPRKEGAAESQPTRRVRRTAGSHQQRVEIERMQTRINRRVAGLGLALLLFLSGAAAAQLQTGNLYGTVKDQQGAPLPGVTATLTGQGAPQVQVSNAQGQFRFLNLAPGG